MSGTDESITDPAEAHARFLRSVLNLEPDDGHWHRPGAMPDAASPKTGGDARGDPRARPARPGPATADRKPKHLRS